MLLRASSGQQRPATRQERVTTPSPSETAPKLRRHTPEINPLPDMLRANLFPLLLLAGLVLGFSSCDDDESPNNPVLGTILDALSADPEYSTFVSALETTGLDASLDIASNRFTVFAPTNAAFSAAGASLDNLSDDELRQVLRYHILQGPILREGEVPDGVSSQATLNRNPADQAVPLTLDSDGTTIRLDDMASTTTGPTEVVNGVYYGIDAVLMPPTVLDRAGMAGNFTTLLSALERAGLDSLLASAGNYTIFAPTDAAFTASGIDLATVSDADLAQLLRYHVVTPALPAASIPAGQSFQTTLSTAGPDGAPLSLLLENAGAVTVNGSATVTTPNQYGTNGVVHVIDEVLEMQSVADFLVEATVLDSLAGLITAAELADDLDGNGPFTVFAPVNAGFTDAADTLATLSMAQVRDVLLYHVAGDNLRSDELTDELSIPTLTAGQALTVALDENDDPVLMTADSTLVPFTATDIQAINGVIHLVGSVLLPDLED